MKTVIDLVTALKTYFTGKDTAAKQAVEANIAPVETDASSSAAPYSVGDQLILNDILYDVTASISISDALVVGTNIAAASDLSTQIGGKQDQIEVTSMPTASASNVGQVLIYIGATTSTYTSGQSYQSTYEGGAYIWKPAPKAKAVSYDGTQSGSSETDVQGAIDDLYSQNQTLTKQITVNGAVNELDHTGVTDTSGTVKFTVNEDKSITVSANSYPVTLDSTITFFFFGTNSTAVPNIFKGKKLVGCPSDGASGTYRIAIQEFSSTTPSGAVAESSDVGEGANISNGDYIRIYIRLGSGYQLTSALTFKPMIFLPELGLSYDDYVPYAKTNHQLTADTNGLLDNMMDNGAVNYLYNANGSASINQVDFNVDSDNIVTLSGTASSSGARYFIIGTGYSYSSAANFKPGIYRFNGTPKTTPDNNVYMEAGCYNSTGNVVGNNGEFVRIRANQTKIFEVPENSKVVVLIWIPASVNASGLVFKPMLSDPSLNLSYDDYVPYAKSNKELTDVVTRLDTDAVKIVDSGLIDVNSSHSFTCTNYSGYRLSIYSIGGDNIGMIVLFGKHPSVSRVIYSAFNCDNRIATAPQISVSGSALIITTSGNNCYYVIEQIVGT